MTLPPLPKLVLIIVLALVGLPVAFVVEVIQETFRKRRNCRARRRRGQPPRSVQALTLYLGAKGRL